MKVVLVVALVLFLSGCSATQRVQEPPTSDLESVVKEDSVASPTLADNPQQTEFTARFEIYTNGTKRIFTDKRYHTQSSDVFIESSEPDRIIVTAAGITWDDFFQSLPMSLTSECIVTGTKQTFCSNEKSTLRFFINGVENKDALNKEIQPNDFLMVEYGP